MINKTQDEIIKAWKNTSSSDPLVSISCITYNHVNYIEQCLDGFLEQETEYPFEILIHDDCSTDGTTEIIQKYSTKYPDIIKPMYETENQYQKGKPAGSLIWNFPRAKGKYIALCEGDDYWVSSEKLQRQFDFMENHLDYSMCFSNAIINCDGVETKEITPNIKKTKTIKPSEIIQNGGMFVPSPSIFYRREILENYPEYNSQCWVGDYPLQIYCAMKGKIYFFNDSLVVYRSNSVGAWTYINKTKTFRQKKKGIESELVMLNGNNKASGYKYNHYFMYHKCELLTRHIFSEIKLFLEGPWYNFFYIFFAMGLYLGKILGRVLHIKIKGRYNV